MQALLQYFNQLPLAGVMLVVAIGWLLGKLEWRGVSLTPPGGVLLTALVLGYFGLSFAPLYGSDDGTLPRMTIGTFGFALFIYAVGFEAGPRFFSSIASGGARFALMALFTNVLALACAALAGRLLGLDAAAVAGALAGAMTSTPALASASELVPDVGRLSVAYALTYPYGQLALLLSVSIVPRLMRKPLTESGAGAAGTDGEGAADEGRAKRARSFVVRNPRACGRELRELSLADGARCIVLRVRRGGEIILPGPTLKFEPGDIVLASGRVANLEKLEDLLGPETYDEEIRRSMPASRRILVSADRGAGRTIAELDLNRRFKVVIVRVERAGEYLDPTGSLVLQRDDVLEVVGGPARVRDAAQATGWLEQAAYETNIAIYALGILAGVLLGSLKLNIAGVAVSLGLSGGLLASGLVLGRFRRIGRFSAEVPRAARQLARDLGILLFISEAGVLGGAALVEGLKNNPLLTMTAGALITTVTVLGSLAFAFYALRLRVIDAWGALCGSMTSTSTLEAVNRAAGSSEAVVGYAATYAIASVLITLAGQMAVRLA